MKRGILVFCAGSVAVLLLLQLQNASPVLAQSPLRWTSPQRIRGIADDSNPPYLVADQNRAVHAFYSQWTGNEFAVFYNQWTLSKGWTSPIDVLLSPNHHQATVLGAFLDARGTMHVIFFGGTELGGEIYYSRAPAISAGQTRAWSTPRIVGDHAGKLISGALVGDEKGNLFIVYSGNGEGNGLYEVQSVDSGDNWSEPKPIFLTNSINFWVFGIQAALDNQGVLHVVWDKPNKSGIAEAVYYARLAADHKEWSFPAVLATLKDCLYKANWASVMPYGGEVFIIYSCGAPPHRLMRRSRDGGMTWSDPLLVFPNLIGENGAPVFSIDSRNVLHILFANRTGDSTTHGVFHSDWSGTQWSTPQAIVSGPPTEHFNPAAPMAVVSQGNLLLVTWRQDPGLSGNPVSFSYASLNAPERPVFPLPTMVPEVTATPSATDEPQSVAPTRAFPKPAYTPQADGASPDPVESNPNIGLVIAILPVVLIILVLVVVRNWRGVA